MVPQLKILDGVIIEISERILAKQNFHKISQSIWNQEQEYLLNRKKQLDEVETCFLYRSNGAYPICSTQKTTNQTYVMMIWMMMRMLRKRDGNISVRSQATLQRQDLKCKMFWKKLTMKKKMLGKFLSKKRKLDNYSWSKILWFGRSLYSINNLTFNIKSTHIH